MALSGVVGPVFGFWFSKRINDFDGLIKLPGRHLLHGLDGLINPLLPICGRGVVIVPPTIAQLQGFFDPAGKCGSHHFGLSPTGLVLILDLAQRCIGANKAQGYVQVRQGLVALDQDQQVGVANDADGFHPADWIAPCK